MHLNNFTLNDSIVEHVSHLKTSSENFVIPSVILVVSIVILICFSLFILKMKNHLNKTPTDSMALDLINSINDRSLLIADLKGDELMEIHRKAIKLHDELGKGAFGVVKRAMLTRDGLETTVAVKMLKSKIRINV